jgi:hypothetical protein
MEILKTLENYLSDKNTWDKPREHHYPSDWYSCVRKQGYGWLNIPRTTPSTLADHLKWEYGKKTEDIIESAIQYAIATKQDLGDGAILQGYEREKQIEGNLPGIEYPISGRIDFILFFQNSPPAGMEVKSSFGKGIADMRREGKPKEDYMKQIFLYAYLTPYKRYLHPYLGRDSGYCTEFDVVYDEQNDRLMADGIVFDIHIDQVIKRLQYVERCIKSQQLPVREYVVAIKNGEMKDKFVYKGVEYKSDWQCNYCAWKDTCWRDVCKEYENGMNINMFKSKWERSVK